MPPQRKGRPFTKKGKGGGAQKRTVVSLVERGGSVRSFHVQHATKAVVRDILVRNADRNSTLYTDQSKLYTVTGGEYAAPKTTNHSAGEYVRYEEGVSIHSNTIENVFSVFRRGMVGVYQHCGEAHLHRYPCRVRFPLQSPHGAQSHRHRAPRPVACNDRRQAPYLSADW